LLIRSSAIALASSGGPNSSWLTAWPARPAAVGFASGDQLARVERGNYRVRPRRASIVLRAGVVNDPWLRS
jgi:hypothetical protein